MRWKPQPGPQTEFIQSEVFELIYGGARGGGKTDAVLGDFGFHAQRHGGAARGLMIRRTRPALEPAIARARQIYRPQGARWLESKSRFEWPSGARLYFRHLECDADAERYQGHDYTRVYVEELTQFPSPGPIDKLKATLRSARGVRCAFRATCNPGGAGHGWVKRRYIDPGPFTEVAEGGLTRTYIPARVADNPALLKADPGYPDRLRQVGSAALVRAWLDGDWSAIEGAFFDGWSDKNIIKPFKPPSGWYQFRSFDWGFASPFSVGWWCMPRDDTPLIGQFLPRGALIRYREWYGADRNGNGLRLDAEVIAAGILERERAGGDQVQIGIADPSIFAHTSGPSIGERMCVAGVGVIPADNTRVGAAGALSGWDQMRGRIAGRDGKPMLYVFDTCRDFIRTVPVLQHDPARIEDLDTNAEDHIADETRYACLFQRMPHPEPPEPRRRDLESIRRKEMMRRGEPWLER